ncbi:MAG: hypothetical protein ICV68_03750, partial [Pyrinomonadaceae bacterium]|nr:hypothetical protein [Pyrinomonadaceae bacterium]
MKTGPTLRFPFSRRSVRALASSLAVSLVLALSLLPVCAVVFPNAHHDTKAGDEDSPQEPSTVFT